MKDRILKIFKNGMEKGRYHSKINEMLFVVNYLDGTQKVIDVLDNNRYNYNTEEDFVRNREFKENYKEILEEAVSDVEVEFKKIGQTVVNTLFQVVYKSNGYSVKNVTDLFRDEKDEYITKSEAADILDRSTRTVNKYLNDGHLDGVKENNKWLVKRSSVEDYKKSKEVD